MRITKVNKNNFEDFKKLSRESKRYFVPTKGKKRKSNLKIYLNNKNNVAYLLYHNRKPIGYKKIILNFKKPKQAYLSGTAIKPKYRGKNLGKKFLELTIRKIKKLKMNEIKARTWSSNKRQQNILKKFNFKKYRTIKKHRINNDDSYWYRLKL